MSSRNPNRGKSNLDGSRVPPYETTVPGGTDGTKDKAEDRLYDSLEKADDMADNAQSKMDDGLNKANDMASDAQSKMDEGKQKAGEMAGMAQDRADQGMDKTADAMDRGADMLRERGDQQGGTVGQVAGTAADAMESAGAYLHDTNTGEMMDQVEAYIRKNPTQSLLVAAGVGFVLAKAFK